MGSVSSDVIYIAWGPNLGTHLCCNYELPTVKSMGIVPMHEWKVPLKYRGTLSFLSGSLGLPWCDAHQLTKHPKYLVLLLFLVVSKLTAPVM